MKQLGRHRPLINKMFGIVVVKSIQSMRVILHLVLKKIGISAELRHITNQVDKLRRDFHAYMTRDGRISMAGVTTSNVDYLAARRNYTGLVHRGSNQG